MLLLLGFSACDLSAQWPLHFDPWSGGHSWGLLLANDRELVVSNRVERMDRYQCHGTMKQGAKERLVSTVVFDAAGNPVYCQDRSRWSSYRQKPEDVGKRPFGKGLVGIVEYRFTYGTHGRLEHVSEVSWSAPFSRDEQDVHFTYDAEGRLTEESIETKRINKPGFEHRGTEYRNDTSMVRFMLAYADGSRVSHMIRRTGSGTTDTLHKDLMFEDVFPMREDTGADTIEVPIVTGHAKLLAGGGKPILSDKMVQRYIYEGGRLIRRETVDRKTSAIKDQRTVAYLSNGLYDATLDEYGRCFERVEYVLRK